MAQKIIETALSYQAPSCTEMDLQFEGMLCQSVDGVTIPNLEYDEDELGC